MALTPSVDAHVQDLLDDVQEVLWREYYHPGLNTSRELSKAVRRLSAVRESIRRDEAVRPNDEGPASWDGGPFVTDDGAGRGR